FEQKQTENALFGELGYQLTDAWQVTVGARYFNYQQDQSSRLDLPLLSGDPTGIAADVLTIDQDESGSLFKINTSYKLTPEIMLYGTVSEGYRLGGINAVPACVLPLDPSQNVCALPNELTFKPDKTRNHEIGIRSTWLERRLVINTDVFYVDWRDVQVGALTVNGNEAITVNGATAVSKGLELQFQAVLPQDLTLLGSYSYSDAQLTRDVPGLVTDNFGPHDALDGDRLPGSPQHTGSLVLQYSRPIRGDYTLRADYAVTYTGDVITKAGLRANGEKLGGYALHQASIGLGTDRWRAALYADNLFDKYAYTGTTLDPTYLKTVDEFTLRRYQHWVIRPRQVGLQLNISF
ncbi:MAG: TonB-dependent receptor, partial [Steroidobacteraceae bacterium]